MFVGQFAKGCFLTKAICANMAHYKASQQKNKAVTWLKN